MGLSKKLKNALKSSPATYPLIKYLEGLDTTVTNTNNIVENAVDNDTIYDDTDLKEKIGYDNIPSDTNLQAEIDAISIPEKTSDLTNDGADGTNAFVDESDSRLTDARTPTSHTHGNLTDDGKIGTNANLPVITTTGGNLTTGSFGNTANSFCEGNDSRLSDARIPLAHNQTADTIIDNNTYSNINNIENNQESINYSLNEIIGSLLSLELIVTDTADSNGKPSTTASADTMGKLYLVKIASDKKDNYDEFITVRAGTSGSYTYSWQYVGESSIELSNYIQKSQTTGLVRNDGTIDTNTYLTQHQDISNYVQKSSTNGLIKNDGTIDSNSYLTSNDITNYVQKSQTPGLIKNDGTIDQNTYLTSHQDISNYVQKSSTAGLIKNDGTIDTNTYLTSHQDITGKADANHTHTVSDITDLDVVEAVVTYEDDSTETLLLIKQTPSGETVTLNLDVVDDSIIMHTDKVKGFLFDTNTTYSSFNDLKNNVAYSSQSIDLVYDSQYDRYHFDESIDLELVFNNVAVGEYYICVLGCDSDGLPCDNQQSRPSNLMGHFGTTNDWRDMVYSTMLPFEENNDAFTITVTASGTNIWYGQTDY